MRFVKDDGGRAAAGFQGDAPGDCVTRAIAIASGLPYRDVYDALYDRARATRLIRKRRSPRDTVHKVVYKPYMEETLGAVWTPTMSIGSGCQVHLRDGEVPGEGRLVVNLSRHLAAVIDGEIRDLYDPSRDGTRCVYGIWRFP